MNAARSGPSLVEQRWDSIAEYLRAALPGLTHEAALGFARQAAPSRRAPKQLADHLARCPDALTSGGSHVPPSLIRLVRALQQAGFIQVVAPVCGDCGAELPEQAELSPEGVGRVCGRCLGRRAYGTCDRCGRFRQITRYDAAGDALCRPCGDAEPAAACGRCEQRRRPSHAVDERGRPICTRCYGDPSTKCSTCGKRVQSAALLAKEPRLCGACSRPREPCGWCGNNAACQPDIHRDGRPACAKCRDSNRRGQCARCRRTDIAIECTWPIGGVCVGCYGHIRRHPRPCPACGFQRPLIALDPHGRSICGPCDGFPTDFACRRCGYEGFLPRGHTCERCLLADRVGELLAVDGRIRNDLAPFAETVCRAPSASAMLRWLAPGQPAESLLQQIMDAETPLTHDVLDAFAPGPALHRLRNALVASGALPQRAEHIERITPWLERLLQHHPASTAQAVRAYASWTVLRRARARAPHAKSTKAGANWARARLRAVLHLLAWAYHHDLDLGTLTQAHIDRWLTTHPAHATYPAREFIGWARRHRLTGDIAIPKYQPQRSITALDDDERWHHLRRCLHEDTLPTEARAAGALVLLFGIPLAHIARLRHSDLHEHGAHLYLTLTSHPLRLPSAVALLLRRQRDSTRAVGAFPDHPTSGDPWLFPGGFPGQPAQDTLYRTLHHAGIPHLARTRAAALSALAAELPAPVLADLLGLHITTATAWGRQAQRDWTPYVAERSANQSAPFE